MSFNELEVGQNEMNVINEGKRPTGYPLRFFTS